MQVVSSAAPGLLPKPMIGLHLRIKKRFGRPIDAVHAQTWVAVAV